MRKKGTKFISIVLAMCMIFAQASTVFADEIVNDEASTQVESSESQQQKEASDLQQTPDKNIVEAENDREAEDNGISQTIEENNDAATKNINTASEEKLYKEGSEDKKIANGIYEPDDFSFAGGSGRTKITCPQVKIINGNAKAMIVFSSKSYTKLVAGGKTYSSIIDEEAKTSTFTDVEVDINKDFNITGTTEAMSKVTDIDYSINIKLTKESKKISEIIVTPDTPSGSDQNDQNNQNDNQNNDQNDDKNKVNIENGTYKVKTTTDSAMFKLDESVEGRSLLNVTDSVMTATITLSGTGYDYLYPGTAEEAIKASADKYCGYCESNGLYSYTVPVAELNKPLNFASHSIKKDQWYDRKITFSTEDIIKVSGDETVKPTNPVTPKPDDSNKEESNGAASDKDTSKESKSWKDASGKSTAAVNNSTTLKDGTYSPKGFSWSGGTGRLSYIACKKVIVKNGQSFAAIEFGSSNYDQLKANGRIYANSNPGGLSTFVIPVKLNANNTIIGRTTAMSQTHWIQYSIFVSLPVNADGTVSDEEFEAETEKLSEKAPEIMGLEYKKEIKLEKAEYFKLYEYNDGITLLQIDVAGDTALYKKPEKDDKNKEKESPVEYDEDGKPIARSQHDITMELYQNNIVNYLLVPEGVELPAGIEKSYVVVNIPADNTFVESDEVADMIEEMGMSDYVKGKADKGIAKIDYKNIVKNQVNLCILSSDVLPEKIDKDLSKKEKEELEKANKEKETLLRDVQQRFTALDIPVIVIREDDEKGKLAKHEWIKAYGAIYGDIEEAVNLFDTYKEKVE